MVVSPPLYVLATQPLEEQANKVLAVLSEFLGINTLFVAVNDGTTNVIVASRNRHAVLVEPSRSPLAEAYCRVVIEDRQYVEIPDTVKNPRTSVLPPTHRLGSTVFVGVPLVLRDGRVIGTLCGMDADPVEVTPRQRMLLDTMAEFLSYVFELEWKSYTDSLTGSGNRRFMDTFMDDPQMASRRKSVVFCDMDNLKPLNDSWGHDVGDEALQRLADHLQEVFGPCGPVCRPGGDEFVVLLPDTPGEAASDMARRVRDAVQHVVLPETDNARISVTMGVASTADPAVPWRDLLRRADATMLEAKNTQKGSVVWNVV